VGNGGASRETGAGWQEKHKKRDKERPHLERKVKRGENPQEKKRRRAKIRGGKHFIREGSKKKEGRKKKRGA
jgi:hypothetical protein